MYNIIVKLYYLKGTLPMNHFFAYINRTKYIRRWGLMRNTETETLSEHLYQTAILAHALAVIENEMFGGCVNAEKIAIAALYHDASEIITGDMPTPIKYFNPEIKDAYKKIEAVAEQELISKLPEDMRTDFTQIYSPSEGICKLIKAADKISALIKCIEELNMGNLEFKDAERSTRKAIKKLDLDEAQIFMDEFIESFYLSLDKQQN